tara:strand:- start:663 stop:1163 length:501 start_codon:yes stop_codon:yes gene_type:complete
MSDFKITDVVVGSQSIDETSTTQNHPLGTIVRATDTASTAYGAGEFIYLAGVASTVVGSFVTYNEDDHSSTLLVANAVGGVATAMSINVASSYGWYQITGKAVGKVKASFADNAACYGTSTAGSADDAVVAGDRIHRCISASAIDTPSTGLAELEMQRPSVDNIAD